MYNSKCSKASYLAVLMILLMSTLLVTAQTICNVDVSKAKSECLQYVQKTGPEQKPSRSCCAVIKPVDLDCACMFVSNQVEQKISMEKAVYILRTCGVNVPPGKQCGSYPVPNN